MKALSIVAVMLLASTLACGEPSETTITGSGTDAPSGATSESQPIGEIGDRVETGGVALTVNGVTTSKRIDDIWTPDSGNIFVIVDVTIENVDREEAPYNPLYFIVKDSDGFEYNTAIAAPDPSLKSGDLAAGDRARGNVAFEVKEGATGLVMSYEPLVILGGFGELLFNLGDAVDP